MPSTSGIPLYKGEEASESPHPPAVAAGRQGLAGVEPSKLRTWSHRTHQWEDDEEPEQDLSAFPRGRSTISSEFAQALATLQSMPEGTAEEVRLRIASSDESVSVAMTAISIIRIQRAARRFLRLRKPSREAAKQRPSTPAAVAGGKAGGLAPTPNSVSPILAPRKHREDLVLGELSRADTEKAMDLDAAAIDARVAGTVGNAMAKIDSMLAASPGVEGEAQVWSGIRYFRGAEVDDGPKGVAHSAVMLTDSMRRWSGVAYYNPEGDE